MTTNTIFDIATGNPNFTILSAALGDFPDLLAAAQNPDATLTVFAPTDDAFAKIPAERLEAILADKELLTSILTYHVVSGSVRSSQVVRLTEAETVQGSKIDISVMGSTVKVNDATVVAVDVEAENGVIHVIDTVILPPM